MIYAVDFDGTIVTDAYPEIGEPNQELIEWLLDCKRRGDKLILWTCRKHKRLDQAVDWCERHGLIFDAVNENLPEMIERFGTDSRKIFADVFIDDRAILPEQFVWNEKVGAILNDPKWT